MQHETHARAPAVVQPGKGKGAGRVESATMGGAEVIPRVHSPKAQHWPHAGEGDSVGRVRGEVVRWRGGKGAGGA